MQRRRTLSSLFILASVFTTNCSFGSVIFDASALEVVTSRSNLSWLVFSETAGHSINDVLSQLGTGGAFEGFRYASTGEVDDLMREYGMNFSDTDYVYTGYETIFLADFLRVSPDWSYSEYGQSDGYSGVNPENIWRASIVATGSIRGSMSKSAAPDFEFTSDRMFHLLVAVPEPGYFPAILVLFLFAVIRRRRR